VIIRSAVLAETAALALIVGITVFQAEAQVFVLVVRGSVYSYIVLIRVHINSPVVVQNF